MTAQQWLLSVSRAGVPSRSHATLKAAAVRRQTKGVIASFQRVARKKAQAVSDQISKYPVVPLRLGASKQVICR